MESCSPARGRARLTCDQPRSPPPAPSRWSSPGSRWWGVKPLMTANSCDGCRFCCWAWAVDDARLEKRVLQHCRHECAAGCALHGRREQPEACAAFRCPYQERAGLHRPDNFQRTLEEAGGNIGNYIPAVPLSIPVEEANRLIRATRTVPASIIAGGQWLDVVLPLDLNFDGGWMSGDPEPWEKAKT